MVGFLAPPFDGLGLLFTSAAAVASCIFELFF